MLACNPQPRPCIPHTISPVLHSIQCTLLFDPQTNSSQAASPANHSPLSTCWHLCMDGTPPFMYGWRPSFYVWMAPLLCPLAGFYVWMAPPLCMDGTPGALLLGQLPDLKHPPTAPATPCGTAHLVKRSFPERGQPTFQVLGHKLHHLHELRHALQRDTQHGSGTHAMAPHGMAPHSMALHGMAGHPRMVWYGWSVGRP